MDQHHLRTLNIALGSHMSAAAYDALTDEMTSFYKVDPEPRFASKMNCALRVSGYAKTGVRGIWCKQCVCYKFHNFVYCPVCLSRGKLTCLLKGCPTEGCLAHDGLKNLDNCDVSAAIRLVKGKTCLNSVRNSEDEIHTSMPLDFISNMIQFKLGDRVKCSRRTDLWLSLKYARDNRRFFALNSLNHGYALAYLGERECSQLIAETCKDVQYPDELRGSLNSAIAKCTDEGSVERSVFDICCSSVIGSFLGYKEKRPTSTSAYSTVHQCYDFERERLLLQRQEEEGRNAVAVNDYLFEGDDEGDGSGDDGDEGGNHSSRNGNAEGMGENEEVDSEDCIKRQLLVLIE